MRRFSKFEKEIITHLVEHELVKKEGALVVSKLAEDLLFNKEKKTSLLVNEHKLMIYYEAENDRNLLKVSKVHTFYMLLEFLDKMKLLNIAKNGIFYGSINPKEEGRYLLSYNDNHTLFELAQQYTHARIFVSESIKDLVENQFKTEEDRRFNEMYNLNTTTFIVTTILSVTAIAVGLFIGIFGK